MQVSLNWIREFCPFDRSESARKIGSPQEIGVELSLHTAEVEAVTEWGTQLGGIVVANVESVEPHPGADRLRLARVDAGGDPLTVVCGAPNVRPGMAAALALPGTVVGGTKIKAAKVRGIRSEGMLCSQKELGVSADGAGLWEIPDGAEVGSTLVEAFPELRDVVFEIDNKSLTHRPDLWGHYGLAREFAAMYRVPLRPLDLDESLATAPGSASVTVAIEGDGVGGRDGLCRRYCGLQIDGVRVEPSPAWLQHRLLAIGSRPINNIVDVTNYVLFELGQPLHAFDTARVGGGKIVVRRARAGEKIRLLDDTTVELLAEDLVIADGAEPVALAGIMGGEGTEISEGATSVFLECANFSPVRVRQTSTRVGKRTDSSLRFEKSLDPVLAREGVLRAAKMILDLCPGAKVIGPLQDVGFEPAERIEIRTDAKFIAQRLGAPLPAREVKESLEWLGFGVDGEPDDEWTVSVPSWRATKDVEVREDLVEEVGRVHGYDNIEPFAPAWPVAAPVPNEHRRFERRAKHYLSDRAGWSEVFTYSMVGAAHCARFGLDPAAHMVLRNPVSEDLDHMRREIVPIHLEKAKENQRYGLDFGFFELGRVYRKEADELTEPGLPDERSRLAGIVSFPEKKNGNFYGVRRVLLDLLARLGLAPVDLLPLGDAELVRWIHPTVSGRFVQKEREFGRVFRVHPVLQRELKLKGEIVAFDLDFDALFSDGDRRTVDYHPPLRYPTVPFDVAVVAASRTPVREIASVIRDAAGEALLGLDVMSVYENLDDGKKSVAFHLVFGSAERTLSGEEIGALQTRVIGSLEDAGFPLR